ncbi:MAG TPA: hypothetical protein VND64_17770 [Pirellulales bacterium]|nr:hypothetical protein [Pirellulales bacterium]
MLPFWFALACLLPAAGPADAHDNPVLADLLKEGVTIGGKAIKLPPPTLADGLGVEDQRAALEKITDASHPLDPLLRPSVVAPFVLKLSSEPTDSADEPARRVDLWFVVYGKLDEVASQDFADRWSDMAGEKGASDDLPVRSGELKAEEIAERKLDRSLGKDEHYLFSTSNLFDRVLISATRQALVTRTDESLLVAARVDPRFDDDAEYPNQWQPLARDKAGKLAAGEVQPYAGAAFYAKVTKLAEPAGALFVEYHQAFNEPKDWFHGANLLRSKLPIVAQDSVREFRRRLRGKGKGNAGK